MDAGSLFLEDKGVFEVGKVLAHVLLCAFNGQVYF